MLIHRSDTPEPQPRRFFHRSSLVVIAGCLAIAGGSVVWQISRSQTAEIRAILNVPQYPVMLQRLLRRKVNASALPLIQIDLKHKHFYTLQTQHALALSTHSPIEEGGEFVPADLQYAGEVMPIDLRLKPGPVAALMREQWSYQVDVRNDDRPFGLKRFSLYVPEVTPFLRETAWLAHLRTEGLLARQALLARVTINGNAPSVVVVENEFSKELLKSQLRPEGLFFSYDEASADEVSDEASNDTDNVLIEPVTRSGHIAHYFGLQWQQATAIALLRNFSDGKLPASTVFNVEHTAKFLAIATLWPEAAVLSNPQAYFYYDPITAKLEPVGFHYSAGRSAGGSAVKRQPNSAPSPASSELSRWAAMLLQDPNIAAVYRREYERLSQSHYLTQLQQNLTSDLQAQQVILAKPFQEDIVAGLWQQLRSQPLQPETLMATANKVASSNVHMAREPAGDTERMLGYPTLSDVLAQHPFLKWNEDQQTLEILPGDWVVEGDLIIPAGISLHAGPGTQLRFEPEAMLISRSPLKFVGTANSRIFLLPQQQNWGGVEVWQADQLSMLEQVEIKNTKAGTFFYSSPLSLKHSYILGSEARDALRLVKSPFSISHSLFIGLIDDAIDTDTADGTIENTQIYDAGGDGIDLSHSRVSIRNVELKNIQDKGLSVGQNSELTAKDIRVYKAAVAFASLDGSSIFLDDAHVFGISKAGLTAYRDRLGFGGSTIEATEVDMGRSLHRALAHSGSQISLNGQMIQGNDDSTYRLYQLEVLHSLR